MNSMLNKILGPHMQMVIPDNNKIVGFGTGTHNTTALRTDRN